MGSRQFSLALAVMITMIPLKPNCGRAAVLVKTYTTYHCNGLLNGCLIADDLESELEFFMDSNVIRILGDGKGGPNTGGTGNPKQPWQNGCEGLSYAQCIAKNKKKKQQNCGTYTRVC
ncbi:hypothetical protein PTKIN_Ptkin07bG0067800 [Pterospermum kingtungense]